MRLLRTPLGIVGVFALVVAVACDRAGPPASVAATPSAPASTVATAPAEATVVSVLAMDNDGTLRLRLSAPSAHAIALDNCNGAFQWGLERRVADTWEAAWGAETDACLSSPIVIAAGTSREFALAITGPDGAALGDGMYRAVVHGLHATTDGRGREPMPRQRRASAPVPFPASAATIVEPR